MPGYSTQIIDVTVRGDPFRLRVLGDVRHDGHAGPSDADAAHWPRFGRLRPSGERLADAMHGYDVDGKRILELGCGIGLASLVLQRRGADVVASDAHPLAGPFLSYNAAINGLPAVRFHRLDWSRPSAEHGRFDLIIASDAMHDHSDAAALADAIGAYAHDTAEVVVTDPGRGHAAHLLRALADHGFWCTGPTDAIGSPPRERMLALAFQRGRLAA